MQLPNLLSLFLLLLLPLYTLADPINRFPFSQNRQIRWIIPQRSFLLRLPTPGLPVWDPAQHIGDTKSASNFVLSFELSPDNSTLLLQGEPFYPLPDANVPPRLHAPQTNLSVVSFWDSPRLELYHRPRFELDYARRVYTGEEVRRFRPPKDADAVIEFDVLGAGVEGHDALLSSEEQMIVSVVLVRAEDGSSRANFVQVGVKTYMRGGRYPRLERKTCSLWSWRCEEIEGEPWYQVILRRDFDRYGRIGSGRWWVMRTWGRVRGLASNQWVWLVLVLAVAWVVFGWVDEVLCEGYEKVKKFGGWIWTRGRDVGSKKKTDGSVEAAWLMREREWDEDGEDELSNLEEKALEESTSWALHRGGSGVGGR
jgi:hypothetical protein